MTVHPWQPGTVFPSMLFVATVDDAWDPNPLSPLPRPSLQQQGGHLRLPPSVSSFLSASDYHKLSVYLTILFL